MGERRCDWLAAEETGVVERADSGWEIYFGCQCLYVLQATVASGSLSCCLGKRRSGLGFERVCCHQDIGCLSFVGLELLRCLSHGHGWQLGDIESEGDQMLLGGMCCSESSVGKGCEGQVGAAHGKALMRDCVFLYLVDVNHSSSGLHPYAQVHVMPRQRKLNQSCCHLGQRL